MKIKTRWGTLEAELIKHEPEHGSYVKLTSITGDPVFTWRIYLDPKAARELRNWLTRQLKKIDAKLGDR